MDHTKVTLKPPTCQHCGSGKRTIKIKYFQKQAFNITDRIIKSWNKQKIICWKCKKRPEEAELWGFSINYKEKNRVFCQECATYIENQLKSIGELDSRKIWNKEKGN